MQLSGKAKEVLTGTHQLGAFCISSRVPDLYKRQEIRPQWIRDGR